MIVDIIIISLVLFLLILAIKSIINNRKNGGCGCGCQGCNKSNCSNTIKIKNN